MRAACRRAGGDPASREHGAVGGAEILVLGFLVLVTGTLLLAACWAVVDAKFAVSSAAREAVRAAVEAPGGSDLEEVATTAADAVFEGRAAPVDPSLELAVDGTTVDGGLPAGGAGEARRCGRVSATVRARVPTVVLPGVGLLLPVDVRATHSEVIDPYRDGLDGEARCAP